MSKVLADFYYNLAILLDAGVPIIRTMGISNQSCKGSMKKVVSDVNETIAGGNSLADGLKKHPKIFSHFDITAVDAADKSGSLPEVLKLLSEWHQFKINIKRKIISGLYFPLIILIFASFIAPLPLAILGNISFLRAFIEAFCTLGVFLLPAFIIVLLIKFTPQRGSFREIFDQVCLKIPLLGKALKHYAVSRFCYTFYILQKAAVPVAETIKTSLESTTNAVVAARLEGGLESAEAGHNVSEGLKNPFVDGFVELWAIGEETGQTDTVAKKLADQNKEESFRYFTLFAEWLPKVVYLFVCLMMIGMILRGLSSIGASYRF